MVVVEGRSWKAEIAVSPAVVRKCLNFIESFLIFFMLFSQFVLSFSLPFSQVFS